VAITIVVVQFLGVLILIRNRMNLIFETVDQEQQIHTQNKLGEQLDRLNKVQKGCIFWSFPFKLGWKKRIDNKMCYS
jgi:hypothetical protein